MTTEPRTATRSLWAMYKDGIRISEPDHKVCIVVDWMQRGAYEGAPGPQGARLKAGYEIKEEGAS